MKKVVKYSGLAAMVGVMTFGSSGTILAQWPCDPEVNVAICTAIGNQRTWLMAPDGAGGAIVAWMDERGWPERDIYAQRVDALGYTKWTADGLPICVVADEQGIPVTVSDGSGGAIIVWEDRRAGYSDIYAQRVDASGASQWTQGGTPVCAAGGFQSNPYVMPDGAGGAIVFWWDKTGFTADWNIYAQRVDGGGNLQWDERGVPICIAGGSQEAPVAVPDGAGGAIVAWRDERGADADIYAQRVNGSGAVQWTEDGVAVCITAADQPGSLLAPDGAGGAILAWHDLRGANYDIYAQRVDGSGAVQWDPDGVPVSTAADDQLEPRVVPDGAGGGIISWYSYRDAYSDVYAQRLDASGSILWTEGGIPIAATATGSAMWSEMVSDGAGGAIITWGDHRSFLTSYDIYAQRVDGSGVVQWTPNGIPISNATERQEYPWLVPDGAGGAIIAWLDSRHTDTDIYAQNVNSDGSLGIPLLSSSVTGGGWIPADDPDKKRVLGFSVHYDQEVTWGHLEFGDHEKKLKVHADTVKTLDILTGDSIAVFSGDCRVDGESGYTLKCGAMDRGNPGEAVDSFNIVIYDAAGDSCYGAGGYLGGGNIRIRVTRGGSQAAGAGSSARTGLVFLENSPNPFSGRTAVSFSLPASGRASLKVYDNSGRLVATVVEGQLSAGVHTATWNADGAASGIYFCRLTAGDFTATKKLVLLR